VLGFVGYCYWFVCVCVVFGLSFEFVWIRFYLVYFVFLVCYFV